MVTKETKGFLMACRGVRCYLGHLEERNDRVFQGRERGLSEICLLRFHMSL